MQRKRKKISSGYTPKITGIYSFFSLSFFCFFAYRSWSIFLPLQTKGSHHIKSFSSPLSHTVLGLHLKLWNTSELNKLRHFHPLFRLLIVNWLLNSTGKMKSPRYISFTPFLCILILIRLLNSTGQMKSPNPIPFFSFFHILIVVCLLNSADPLQSPNSISPPPYYILIDYLPS